MQLKAATKTPTFQLGSRPKRREAKPKELSVAQSHGTMLAINKKGLIFSSFEGQEARALAGLPKAVRFSVFYWRLIYDFYKVLKN